MYARDLLRKKGKKTVSERGRKNTETEAKHSYDLRQGPSFLLPDPKEDSGA